MAQKTFGGMAIGVVLIAGMATAGAFAHDHEKMGGMMDRMDTNHDGVISADEHAVFAKSMFDKMDADHDGKVTKAEMEAGMKAMHEEHEERDEHHEHMMKDDKHDAHEKKEAADEASEEMNEKKDH